MSNPDGRISTPWLLSEITSRLEAAERAAREHQEARERAEAMLAAVELHEKADIIADAQKAMEEAERRFEEQIANLCDQVEKAKDNAAKARTDCHKTEHLLQEWIDKSKADNQKRLRAENVLAKLQAEHAAQQDLISTLERSVASSLDRIKTLENDLASAQAQTSTQSGDGDATLDVPLARGANQAQHGATSDQGDPRAGRNAKRPVNGDGHEESTVASQPAKRAKTSTRADTAQVTLSNEAEHAHDRHSSPPMDQVQSLARRASGLAATITPRSTKLSIKNYVTGPTRTIWDNHCKVGLRPFIHKGRAYEVGDVVMVKNPYRSWSCRGRPFNSPGAMPDRLIGVLCDYTMYIEVDSEKKPTSSLELGKDVVTYFRVAYLTTPYDIADPQNEGTEEFESLDSLVDNLQALVRNPRDATGGLTLGFGRYARYESFAICSDATVIFDNVLLGHVDPLDVGTGPSSKRPIVVNWSGPALIEFISERYDKNRGRLGSPCTALVKRSGVPDGVLPDGWVDE
ncbi:unnamed protein product [Peniophora sp. CBMAI 1063]|nr:unnamed protein product [Peniophora sp. CBMAI 1063]